MKKLFLLFILFLFPFSVFAKSCDQNNIEIESIELSNTTGSAEEVETSVVDKKININVRLKEVGDAAEYDVKIKNKSSEDYYLNDNNLPSSDYIDYQITYDDDTSTIKGNSTKDVNIRVEYKSEVPEELLEDNKFIDNNSFTWDIANEKIVNPKTGNYFILICSIIIIINLIIICYFYKTKYLKVMLFLLSFIPLSVFAICKADLEVETCVSIIKDIVVYPNGKNRSTVVAGDLVSIGTEDFYVVKHDGDDLVLLARYNLKVGNIASSNYTIIGEYSSSDTGYGLQSSEVKGYVTDGSNFNGVVPFSTTNYWVEGNTLKSQYTGSFSPPDFPYVYDSNSSLYPYVESYKSYLELLGLNIKEARILKYSEAVEIGCDYSTTKCSSTNSFVYNTSYWLGNAYNSHNFITYIFSDNRFPIIGYGPLYSADNGLGIRPVIVI